MTENSAAANTLPPSFVDTATQLSSASALAYSQNALLAKIMQSPTAPEASATTAVAQLTPTQPPQPPAEANPVTLSAQLAAARSSLLAGQTPFSVFFSDPPQATQSAASVLPKMMLPSSGPIELAHGTPSVAQNISAQVPANPSSAKPTTGSQAPQSAPAKPQSTAEVAATLNSPTTHNNVDPSGASDLVAPVASAQIPIPVASPQVTGAVPTPAAGTNTPQSPSVAPPAPAAATAAPAPPEAPPANPIQAAQLISRAGQAEMRIGVNTSAFGSVEVHTVVRTNDVGLVIGSEKGDLHSLLSSELPAIANNLQQQNLRLNSVSFMQGFASPNNAGGGGGNFQQRSFAPAPPSPPDPGSEPVSDDTQPPVASARWGGAGTLSILA